MSIRSCTPVLTLANVVRAGGKVSDAIIRWAENHDLVASGEDPKAEVNGMNQADYALAMGALEYIDADDGRVKGQIAPTDDTPEDEILHDIGGSPYLIGDWSDDSVVELVVPDIDDAIQYPDITWHMCDAAGRHHSKLSNVPAWCELVEHLGEIIPIVRILQSHGDRFTGRRVGEVATEWHDASITDASDVDAWCEIGVWNAATALAFISAGLSPDDVLQSAESINEQPFGDPIYAACNGDISVDVIIAKYKANTIS